MVIKRPGKPHLPQLTNLSRGEIKGKMGKKTCRAGNSKVIKLDVKTGREGTGKFFKNIFVTVRDVNFFSDVNPHPCYTLANPFVTH